MTTKIPAHSPGYLIALMEIHALPHPEINTALLRDLLDDGLITWDVEYLKYQTTAKACAFIDMLSRTPFPISAQTWIDPRDL